MGDGHTSTLENPFHYYPTHDDGDYTTYLYTYTEFGCVDSAYVIIHVEDELYLFVPNTFTPDGDDYNEVFLPIINGDFNPEDYTLYIFNRWGELVFESHNHLVGWNGTYGEGYNFICQDGTYTWKIIVGDEESAEKNEFVGHVNLLK